MLVPSDPAIRLGVLLVLLVPCTDWFITFTHLAGGDTRLAIAFSPASLLLQIILLPVYLWAFLGEDLVVTLTHGETLSAFTGLIVLPLFAAYMTEKWVERGDSRSNLLNRLAWFPVPLLAIVVFSIAATQVSLIMATSFILGWLLLIFVVFLIIAGWIARLLASWFALPGEITTISSNNDAHSVRQMRQQLLDKFNDAITGIGASSPKPGLKDFFAPRQKSQLRVVGKCAFFLGVIAFRSTLLCAAHRINGGINVNPLNPVESQTTLY
jgi:ACR3 family arsenite efflux pump ArsB